jgi:hypothetical protein
MNTASVSSRCTQKGNALLGLSLVDWKLYAKKMNPANYKPFRKPEQATIIFQCRCTADKEKIRKFVDLYHQFIEIDGKDHTIIDDIIDDMTQLISK